MGHIRIREEGSSKRTNTVDKKGKKRGKKDKEDTEMESREGRIDENRD